MIIKLQSLLFPLFRHREEKKSIHLTKKDRVNGDRLVIGLLFLLTIVGAIAFS